MTFSIRSAALAAALAIPGFSVAAPISVQNFAAGDIAGARSAYAAFFGGVATVVVEDFEGFTADEDGGDTPAVLGADVGAFSGVNSNGSGSSAVNGGETIEIRRAGGSADDFGRRNLTNASGADAWLDSNDLGGMDWKASVGGGLFDRVGFFLTDAGDVSGQLTVDFGGGAFSGAISGLKNGQISFVGILFGAPTDAAHVGFRTANNDGFGIDEASVGLAPVPLPAALPMLGAALGCLGVAASRRRRA